YTHRIWQINYPVSKKLIISTNNEIKKQDKTWCWEFSHGNEKGDSQDHNCFLSYIKKIRMHIYQKMIFTYYLRYKSENILSL
ncbi:hypothetical protein, partial [Yersinia massiliensis]|uniref:hypothetical protein n=1 Tax=Yersinia massiliensis TaxID=419257 RepID=UPI001C98D6BB